MGLLINGKWQDKWYETKSTKGEFVRQESIFRHWVGTNEFPVEKNRYHLFVSLACPWAHRTLIFRKLKKLENIIDVTVVDPLMFEHGWEFSEVSENNPHPDFKHYYQMYTLAKPDYTGRVTVPILWDKKQNTIVNNESSEIIRMFNTEFNVLTGESTDYYPEGLREEIHEINDEIYENVNNGVYRAGFATTQQAYEKAFFSLFTTLDRLEQRLDEHRYLLGDRITEADWRLFTTLIRFDSVYVGHFKTNLKRIEDYRNLSEYLRELYQIPGIADTVNFDHIKSHYYQSHSTINPTGIVPVGPSLDYLRPHNRDKKFSREKS